MEKSNNVNLNLGSKKMEELKKASKPLVDFVNKNCCPHDIIVIQQGNVQIFNGEMSIPTEILD